MFALVGSIGLGCAIAIARIAYEEGANGLSIAFPRAWLLVILLLFSWMALVDLVRAEFLRCRNMDYVLSLIHI